eukprot:PhF_6_TR24400/c0_g1_i1/m.33768
MGQMCTRSNEVQPLEFCSVATPDPRAEQEAQAKARRAQRLGTQKGYTSANSGWVVPENTEDVHHKKETDTVENNRVETFRSTSPQPNDAQKTHPAPASKSSFEEKKAHIQQALKSRKPKRIKW